MGRVVSDPENKTNMQEQYGQAGTARFTARPDSPHSFINTVV